MREIKFRAYGSQGQGMFEVQKLDLESMTANGVTNCTIMQYTGFKDKNGVEIYEGDIGRWTSNTTKNFWVVKFGDWVTGEDYYDTDAHDVYGWFVERTNDGSQASLDISFEVIGNIYENPELV